MLEQGAPGDSYENYAFMYYEGSIMTEDDVEDVQIVDARYNFWNSAMGPYSDPAHFINPNEDGTGPQVEDAINFAPWWIDDDMDTLTVDVFISENKNLFRQYVDGVDEVFYTIQSAVDAAHLADWVIVNPGAYYERVVVVSSLSLLGGYQERGGYYDAGMYGVTPGYVDILLIEGDEVSATVDNFDFLGAVTVLVNVRGATAIVSNNYFEGSLTGPAYEFNGQIAVLVDDIGTINVYGNMFDNIALDGEQDRGAVAVYSDSAADIHDNYFYGYETATGVWAWDVTEPLNIVDNYFYGFWFGVNIEMSEEDSVPSTGIYIAGNYMDEILVGIAMYNVENTLIEENTIYGEEDLPYWYTFDYSFDIMVGDCGENVVVVNNNLLSEGNMDDTIGVWNEQSDGEYFDVIANNNWWGKVSGPSGGFYYYYYGALNSYFGWNYGLHTAFGAGSMVTEDVIVDTWLCNYFPIGTPISASYDAPIYVYEGMAHRYSPLTGVEITDVEGDGLVALGKYTSSPGKMFWGYNLGIYLEIVVNHESVELDSMTVEIYYGAVPADINAEELRLFFWNTEVGAWMPCIASFVDVDDGYVEMTFDHDSLPTIDMLRNDTAFLIGAPKLVITPTEGKSGIIVEAYGAGFTPMQAVVMYIGKDVLGAIPTKLEGLYFVDEDGNVSDVEIILPYLNKGEYDIKMTDPIYLAMFGEEYVASATYTVLGNSALQLALDTGAMYFAGEDVWWIGSVTEEGTPYEFREDTTIAAYIVSAATGEKLEVEEVNILEDGYTFTVHIVLPGEVDAGVYYLEVEVADAMYQGQDGKAFQISSTFSGLDNRLISIQEDIAALSVQVREGFETVNVKLDAIDARVIAIEGDVAWIRTTLGDVKATVDQIDLNVIDVQDGIVILGAQIASGFSTVQSSLESLDGKIIDIQDSIAVLSSVVGEIRVYVGQIDANVTVANDGIVTLISSVGTVQTTLNAIGAQVTTINGNVATLQTAVGTVQTSINALDAKIVALQGSVATISTNLGTLTATVNEIGLKVTEINGRTVTMSSTLGNITGTLTAMTGSIATINTNLGTVKTDVGNIASATTGINSTLAFIILAILIIVAIVLVFLRTKK
jgi:methyl-accepting chemotaxis protein